MKQPQVALDLDGVLADTHNAVAERSDKLDPSQCPPDNWNFESEEQQDHFLHVAANLWHNHTHHISPTVDNLQEVTERLSYDFEVDIVTHRTGTDKQIKTWLDGYGVYYNDFYSTTMPKSNIGEYDIHIDDSPNVAEDVTQNRRYCVVIDAAYNADYNCNAQSTKVDDIEEAVELLRSVDVDRLCKPVL